jgi:hypothetical protein
LPAIEGQLRLGIEWLAELIDDRSRTVAKIVHGAADLIIDFLQAIPQRLSNALQFVADAVKGRCRGVGHGLWRDAVPGFSGCRRLPKELLARRRGCLGRGDRLIGLAVPRSCGFLRLGVLSGGVFRMGGALAAGRRRLLRSAGRAILLIAIAVVLG